MHWRGPLGQHGGEDVEAAQLVLAIGQIDIWGEARSGFGIGRGPLLLGVFEIWEGALAVKLGTRALSATNPSKPLVPRSFRYSSALSDDVEITLVARVRAEL
jgi:hypothetical protein